MNGDQSSTFDVITRLRTLESKQEYLREKLLVVNQNMIEEYKELFSEIKTINSDVKEIKHNLLEIQDAIKKIAKEIENFAPKESLKILEKYINIWNPLNFVTEQQLQNLIKKGDHHAKRTKSKHSKIHRK